MSLTDRHVHDFFFAPGQGFDPRADSTLSDATKIRLDEADHRVKLKRGVDGTYPLDANLSVRTWLWRPQAARRLLALELKATLPTGTSVGFRLWDGATEYVWKGTPASWKAAAAGEWMTEDGVNAHLAVFPLPSPVAVGFRLNLLTTDEEETPVLDGFAVLWEGEVDWTQDLVLDSLVPQLRAAAVYPVDFALPPVPAVAGGPGVEEVALGDYQTDGRLEVVDVIAAFDHTADPGHLVDVLDDYDPATRTVALDPVVPYEHVIYLRMRCAAAVAWDTNQDLAAVRRLPEVVLRNSTAPDVTKYPLGTGGSVVRRDTGNAVVVPPPTRVTWHLVAEVRTDRTREQARVLDALLAYLEEGPATESGPFVRSVATDRRFRLRATSAFDYVEGDDALSDVRLFRAEFLLVDAALELRPAEDAKAVRRFKINCGAALELSETGEILRTTAVETVTVS